jgi:hypothetical protein
MVKYLLNGNSNEQKRGQQKGLCRSNNQFKAVAAWKGGDVGQWSFTMVRTVVRMDDNVSWW